MTIDTCCALLDGWILGTVPAGIVCDALIDLGLDPDTTYDEHPWESLREHLAFCDSLPVKRGRRGVRSSCAEMIRRLIRRELLDTPANHQEHAH